MPRTAATSPLDRALGRIALVLAVAALLAFAAVIIATFTGVHGEAWSSPAWITVFSVAFWGLPIALILALVLVIRRVMRRDRDAAADAALGASE